MKEKIVFNTKKEVNRRTSVFKVGDIISIPSTLTDSEVSKKAKKTFVFASNHACRCLFIRCMSHDIKFVHIIREFIKEGEM